MSHSEVSRSITLASCKSNPNSSKADTMASGETRPPAAMAPGGNPGFLMTRISSDGRLSFFKLHLPIQGNKQTLSKQAFCLFSNSGGCSAQPD